MLPFLKPKKIADTIIMARKKDGSQEVEGQEGQHPAELMEHAEGMIQAMHNKDANALAMHAKAMHNFLSANGDDDAADEE